jgi:hypothetical protein
VDPVTLILTALAAGAGSGLNSAVSSAVTDAYQGVKALVARKLAGRPNGELVLAQHELDPRVWDRPLAQELSAAGVGDDLGLVAAAQALMQLADAAGSAAGKYTVVAAADHGLAAGGDVHIAADRGGMAAGVIHGNVVPPDPTGPGSAQERPDPGLRGRTLRR